jgi:hypothetical protein
MMDRFRLIGHPIVLFVLICAFVFVYFVYLRGGGPLSFSLMTPSVKPATEAETERNAEPPQENEINAAPWTLPGGPQQDPLNQPNPPDQPNQRGVIPVNQGTVPPVPPNQNVPLQPIAVPDLALQEGHWIGLEVIPLTPAIAKANSIPPDVVGVLIDEVTLLAAEAGLLAGDVITAVNDKKVVDLKSFWQATKDVGQANRAGVALYSGGKNKNVVIFSTEALGMAQMEAAPMILATDKSPHGYYGPCDKCHTISKTPLNAGQLAKDQGDVLTRVAPTIRKGTPPPHRRRGTCSLCHVVL